MLLQAISMVLAALYRSIMLADRYKAQEDEEAAQYRNLVRVCAGVSVLLWVGGLCGVYCVECGYVYFINAPQCNQRRGLHRTPLGASGTVKSMCVLPRCA